MNTGITALIGLLAAAVLGPMIIPLLVKLKFGQRIREIGPAWHSKKSGTPTMGGVIFMLGLAVAVLARVRLMDHRAWLVLFCMFGFGLVGFVDDFIKVAMKRNLGLRAWQKLTLQIIVAALFVFIGLENGLFSTAVSIPFTSWAWDMKWLFIPFAILVLLAAVNGVNLTDGIDGLATSVTAVVVLFFGVLTAAMPALCHVCFGLAGALIGFLIYNKTPAKVFMGDTGSLFLGGAVGAFALMLENPLILLLAGIVYVVETLSVMIQVTSFKLTGRRVFKMSPIHHHFEMCGWSERKIVLVFTAVTLLGCIAAYFGIGGIGR